MKKEWLIKNLALGIVFLFIVITVTPILGISNYLDDTNPPVTTISFNPPEPDGDNGWYVSNVTVILNAADEISGVNITKYRIDGGIWQTYTEPFILDDDGEDILIEFYSIDNAGNQEEIKSAEINIDKTIPDVDIAYLITGANPFFLDFSVTATAYDDTSGTNKAEFYVNHEFQVTVKDPGPIYHWIYHYVPSCNLSIRGLICNSKITDEYVKFFAIIIKILRPKLDTPLLSVFVYDNAGNWNCDYTTKTLLDDCIYYDFFDNIKIPNNYTGHIGRFFIYATFYI